MDNAGANVSILEVVTIVSYDSYSRGLSGWTMADRHLYITVQRSALVNRALIYHSEGIASFGSGKGGKSGKSGPAL